MKSGRCLCGAVRFTAQGALTNVVTCHCKMCQRWHGAPGPYANAKWDGVRFERQDTLGWYESSPGVRRGFCRECGSSLFWQRIASPEVSIAAGSLDEPTGLTSEAHIFVADKGGWYEITDGLRQFPASSAKA